MSSITSPEDPDEQFEFGVRLLQQSWRTKVRAPVSSNTEGATA